MVTRERHKNSKSATDQRGLATKSDDDDDQVVVAFLALGSIGDSLPLCALAVSIAAGFEHSRHQDDVQHGVRDDGVVQKQQQQKHQQQQKPDVGSAGVDHGCGDNDHDQKSKRRRMEHKERKEHEEHKEHGTVSFGVVTHRCHCELLLDLMESTYDVKEPLPRLCPVDVPVLFGGTTNTTTSSATSTAVPREADTGRACADADEDGPVAEEDENDAVCKEMDACMRVLEDLKPKVLIFNLFSAFGYHLADALGIPCLCASPGVPPSCGGVPLGRVLPRELLRRIDDSMDDGGCQSGDEITRADLELWMLPLFHPRYRRWRRAQGLPPDVYSSSALPRAPPILFGVSPTVLPRPGYWPAKADVCGFWSFPRVAPSYLPPNRLIQFLSKCEAEGKPVYVIGLGSMPELGLVQDPSRILEMAVSCLGRTGAAAVLLPTPNAPPRTGAGAAAGARLAPSAQQTDSDRGHQMKATEVPEGSGGSTDQGGEGGWQACLETDLLDLTEEAFVPYKWLLPRCRGIVHHGGSGTTGAALSAGIVQVVIPLAFDQFFFADQVEYMGVGVRVHGTRPRNTRERSSGYSLVPEGDGVTMAGMEKALQRVLSEDLRVAAARYREALGEEDGMGVACAKISVAIASTAQIWCKKEVLGREVVLP